MKFDIAAIFEQVVSFYARLPLAQKIALPLLIFGSMGVVVFVSKWATQPEYQVLFSNLEESDAAGIVERLKDQKIGYRLRGDGKTIDVTPPDLVHEIRLEMASVGLPKGGNVGFELWNEPKLGLSAFGEAMNFIRAVQGELERTISSIQSVRSVRVHITNPKRSVFVKRDVPPTASVLLRLKAGSELTPQQVKGIANLVAGSVERLTPENVTILDQDGNMLNESKEKSDLSGADLTQLEYRQALEREYVRRIETMLSEILGPGRSVARVTAEMDFNRFEKEEEAYDPSGTVARSERTSRESAGLTADGGVPGVLSNLTNDPSILAPPDSTENANTRTETVRNYEVSRAVSRTVAAPGKITKLSVAVLVDGQYVEGGAAAPDAESADKLYKPLSGEMLRKMENLVKQAVGFDSTRGDVVTVENIRFVEPDESLVEALEAAEATDWMRWAITYVPAVLFILLFFMVMMKPLVRFLVTPSESEVDLSRLLPAGIEELEAELEAERAKANILPTKAEPSVNIEELEQLLSENSRMVKDNPQQAALLIRYWLNDGRI
ncbi:MAG: flagellar M-ring protein FliF [Bdellovibrionales bacterium]|nr:flagellar M-ring protein FliF [Bdellovibrionales bacterium]